MGEENNQGTGQDSSQDTQGSGEPEVVDMDPRVVQEGLDDPAIVDMKPRRVTQDFDPKRQGSITKAHEILKKLNEIQKEK